MKWSETRTNSTLNDDRVDMMATLFENRKRFRFFQRTENPLYDAAAAYCSLLSIPIASLKTVISACGEDFDLQDIARVSHITARRIKLTEGWYKSRSFPLIAIYKDEKPLLCMPKGLNTIQVYDVKTGAQRKMTEAIANELNTEAYIFYKPLPEGSLTIKNILHYGVRFAGKADLFNIVLMTLLSTLVGLLLPFLNEQLFDKLIPMGSYNAILQLGMVILACSIGNIFFLMVKNLASFRSVTSVEYAVVNATLERLFQLPQQFIERFGNIDLVSRALGIYDGLQGLGGTLITAVLGGVFSIVYLIRMFSQSQPLSFRALIMVLITALLMLLCNLFRSRYEKKALEESYQNQNTLFGFIAGIIKVRLSCMEDRALFEYQRGNVEQTKNSMDSANWSIISGVISTAMTLVYSGVLYYTVVSKDIDITLGQYTAFSSAFGLFTSSIMQLANLLIQIPRIKPIFERALPIFEQPVESYASGGLVDRYTGRIEVDNLEFAYGTGEKNVLDGISFQINPGEYVGFVGPSGCGKSTLLKCLMGFEEPTRGNIYYDDKDISTVDKRELRRQMGVVLQQGSLVIGTIYENIALANPSISPADAQVLLVEAGMGADIERMPMGIYTSVSEFGGSVSGGQQQRILIARALANDPCMLLMDEATSALDNIAQQTLCDTLEQRKVTRLVIAHRLSTIEGCDRIYVMNQGKIVEQGTFPELMEKKGLLYEMARNQLVE